MKKLNKRILSVILAFIIFMTNCPMVTSADEGFSISCDGDKVAQVEFYKNEKLEISADNLISGASYQWQIQIPGTDTWIDIQGQTGKTLKLTYALLGSLLDNEHSANVRCAAISDGESVAYTESLEAVVKERPKTVQESAPGYLRVEEEIIEEEIIEEEIIEEEIVEEEIVEEEIVEEEIIEEEIIEEEIIEDEPEEQVVPKEVEQIDEIELTEPVAFVMPRNINMVSTNGEEPGIDENTKIVSVVVEYYYEDRQGNAGDMVMDPYVARIPAGDSLNVQVPCKIFPGYEIKLVDPISGVSLQNNEVTINLNNVSENQTIVVHYKEIKVPYYARYFMQNVYNDLYTEKTDILSEEQEKQMLGFADEQPNEELVYPDVKGFSPLFYQPDKIAADGSTVFEVYYDRNYYLINFDLDGGYGTAPVYARYETVFAVSNPVKPGFRFDGWELTSYTEKTDGTAEENAAYNEALQDYLDKAEKDSNGLIKKIPYTNLTYTAKWIPLNTTYTVAYWLRQNTDGQTKDLYLGNRIVSAEADDEVDGEDDLSSDMLLCGLGNHTHTQSCYTIPNHTHSNQCVDVTGLRTEDVAGNYNDITAIRGIGTPESGYLYTIHVEDYWDTNTYYKLYLDGQWYSVDASYLSGVSLGEGRYDTGNGIWVANKYYANLPLCDYSCEMTCGESHIHSESCKQNTRMLEFVKADQKVTVKGDGSTVVNVYYQYKEYTLKFYYAATTGDANHNGLVDANETGSVVIVGGSTTYFGTNGTDTADDKTLLSGMFSRSGELGKVDEVPQLNEEGKKRNYELGMLIDDKGTQTTSDDSTYHYITFKARYGDDISELWPCGVFESVTRTDKNTTSPTNGWSGTEAFASAWNGEHHVKYSQSNSNQTIKGVYEELDDEILFHPNYEDSQEVSYLCFWENGAEGKNWNAPELYVYNVWLPFQGTDEEFENIPESEKRVKDEKKYWLYRDFYTCDDSNIEQQTDIAITGYEEDFREWSVYFIGQAKYGYVDEATTNPKCFYVVRVNDSNERKYERAVDLNAALGKVWCWPDSDDVNMTVRDYSNVNNIVETPNESGTYLLHTEQYDPSNPGTEINHTLYREAYSVDFYYKSNEHRIFYRNYNKNMGSGEGAIVPYGKSLAVYGAYFTKTVMEENYYPDVLEPGAYGFAGWCTSADCLPGTEMDWSSTMPDSDLTVYAKWIPKIYTVKFYLNYDRLQSGADVWYVKTDAEHGQKMKDLDQGKILPANQYTDENGKAKDYRFVGWFYIDAEGKKTAFNPSEMEVRQNLELYAEWSTKIVKEYTIHYKLGKLSDDQKTVIPINQGEEGYRVLSESTTGYAFEASTRTFAAKSEDQLSKLTEEEKEMSIWVPHTNSHSILMKENNEENEFTFWYVAQSNIPYTVRYLDATTNEPVIFNEDGTEYIKTQNPNTHAVVTEQFEYVPGYIPDAFHKTLILSVNPDGNIIVFYYTKDENYEEDGDDDDDIPDKQSARYLVTHYIQDIAEPDADPASYTYSVYTTEDLIGIVGDNVSAEALQISGFTFNEQKTEAEKGINTVKSENGKWYVEGKVTTGENAEEALQLELYYLRNKYSYTVEYLDADTLTPIHEEKTTEAKFTLDYVVEETALENIKGYDLYGEKKQTLKISAIEELNVITFLYTPKAFTVNYVPICKNPDLTGGYVLTTAEYNRNIVGTTAVAYAGFKFMGWYSDEESTHKVGDNAFYKPDINADDDIYEYTFYALFEPITLKITQSGMTNEKDSGIYEIVDSSDKVFATVMITGNSSVVLAQIPAGSYSIREISDNWTWTYADSQGKSFTVDISKDNQVIFQHKGKTVDWLHDEHK